MKVNSAHNSLFPLEKTNLTLILQGVKLIFDLRKLNKFITEQQLILQRKLKVSGAMGTNRPRGVA